MPPLADARERGYGVLQGLVPLALWIGATVEELRGLRIQTASMTGLSSRKDKNDHAQRQVAVHHQALPAAP